MLERGGHALRGVCVDPVSLFSIFLRTMVAVFAAGLVYTALFAVYLIGLLLQQEWATYIVVALCAIGFGAAWVGVEVGD